MSSPWPTTPPTAAQLAAFAQAEPRPYWTATLSPDEVRPALEGTVKADLCIVGAGFTGLWAALHGKRQDPSREVVVLEGETAGFGASGRNGGFVASSLTHGVGNGLSRFGPEMHQLERLGLENFHGLIADVARLGIDCDLEQTGDLSVMLEPHQEEWVHEEAEVLRQYGHEVEELDGPQVRAQVASPTYRAGLWVKSGSALVDPGKLVAGLRQAALDQGVRLFEHTPVASLREAAGAMELIGSRGRVRAQKVLLATSAYSPLVPAIRRRVLPVYDYVLMTEPLSAEQRASIGWSNRQGLADASNQFHYYRQTADGRILFGGYDAVYRYGGRVDPSLDESPATFGRLAQHFFTTFPQLEGLRFSHRWGGAIDTCSRFSVYFGSAYAGRVRYAVGYTGLGVGATRFGAQVALDLLDGRSTEATELRYVKSKPVPFPPEPLRTAVVQLTRNRLAAADRNLGRRGPYLRVLDRLGLGFDS